MYNCRKCGHALPSNSALCPNCGTMMDSRQLAIKKSLNSPNSAYLEKLEAIKNKKFEFNPSSTFIKIFGEP